MWRRTVAVSMCAALGLAAAPNPDLPPLGRKVVPTSVEFEVAAEAAAQRFVVVGVFGGIRDLATGDRHWLRPGPRGLTVCAVAADEVVLPPDATDRNWAPDPAWLAAHPRVELPLGRTAPVAVASPVDSAVHRVRILGVDGEAVRWELIATERLDAAGEVVDLRWRFAALSLLAAVGIGGLVWLGRRRRSTEGLAG